MTVQRFLELIDEYDIPTDILIESDSGWECGPTDVDSFAYNAKEKRLVGLQYTDTKYLKGFLRFSKDGKFTYTPNNGWIFIK